MPITLNNDLTNRTIGDYMWCQYTANAAGSAGTFADLAAKDDATVNSMQLVAPTDHQWLTQSTTVSSQYPVIAIDSSGTKHVVFMSNIYNATYYNIGYYTISPTGTISGIQWLTTSTTSNSQSPAIAIDSSGTKHVVFQSNIYNATYQNIGYVTISSAGVISAIQWLTQSTTVSSQSPTIAIDSSGTKHVVFYSNIYNITYFNIGYYTISSTGTISGIQWLTQSTTVHSQSPAIAIDSSSTKHVVFHSNIYNATYANVGYITISSSGVISGIQWLTTSTTTNSYNPTIAIDSSGTKHVVLHSNIYNATYINIGYITISSVGAISGIQWLTTSTAAHSQYPMIAIDSSGTKHVVFRSQNYNATYNNIGYVTISSVGAISGIQWLTTSTVAHSYYPVIAIDSNGMKHVVFYSQIYNASYMNIAYDHFDSIDSYNVKKALTSAIIPVTASPEPNGYFKFIYVGNDVRGRKVFVADRNIQHSISWDALNTAGFTAFVPVQISGPTGYNFRVRMLTGPVIAGDAMNDWYNYIVNSTLNGNIVAGDNAVWNWSGIYSWVATVYPSATARGLLGSVSVNGLSNSVTSAVNTAYGFRPLLIVEPSNLTPPPNSPRTLSLAPVSQSFSTMNLTNNTLPLTVGHGTTNVTFNSTGPNVTVDVTNLVQEWVNGVQVNGLMFDSPVGLGIQNSPTVYPQLNVEYYPLILNQSALITSSGPQLSWTQYNVASDKAAFLRYEVWRYTTPNFAYGTGTQVATITDIGTTSYMVTNDVVGQSNYYQVFAIGPATSPSTFTANLCSGGTPIENGHYSNAVAASAFDGSTTTYWEAAEMAANQSGTSWIGYDFGLGKQKIIRQIKFYTYGTAGNNMPSLNIQSSQDGIVWSTITTQSVATTTSAWITVNVPYSTAARYWRLMANANLVNGNAWLVEEIQMMETNELSANSSNSIQCIIPPTGYTSVLQPNGTYSQVFPAGVLTDNPSDKSIYTAPDHAQYKNLDFGKVTASFESQILPIEVTNTTSYDWSQTIISVNSQTTPSDTIYFSSSNNPFIPISYPFNLGPLTSGQSKTIYVKVDPNINSVGSSSFNIHVSGKH